ncbi:MAG: lysoplasmalogenase family protein [Sphingorhabdus sp.]
MQQDLIHKRPWLAASLAFGLSYPLSWQFDLPTLVTVIWKMAGVALLTGYVLRRHHTGEFFLLAVIMVFWSIGDGLLEFDMVWGAIAFTLGHMVAVLLFLRHRRVNPAFSQKLLAIAVLALAPVIAYYLPTDQVMGLQAAGYMLFMAAMAACAWNSNFPRYRVGLGAMAFVVSDLLIFAHMGPLADAGWTSLAIWFSYYGGVMMIATGVVTTLVKRGHYVED